jgi:2-polyprenyl-3-methyl-5-hydroxy-6-metoxy-1,4-benzoquinol methylase
VDFSVRSMQPERLDDPGLDPAEVARCLADLSAVNTVTLARPPTLNFLRRVVRTLPAGAELSVLDVGYGHGDMLRRIARWGRRRGLRLRLEGVALSPACAASARAATPAHLAITYRTGDVFDEQLGSTDVVISSLLSHHLLDDQVVRFLRWMEHTARRGWFVNDLHRHPVAYYGFAALSRAAAWHEIVQHDGKISVMRSFRRAEWERLLRQAGLYGAARVRWHVPFRLCVSRVR